MKLPWSTRRGDAGDLSLGLAEECEALLEGTLAEVVVAEGWRPHPAVWLNTLAHGSFSDLVALAARAPASSGRAPRSWPEARGMLARAVLSLAADEEQLEQVQTAVLVPLELQFFSISDAITPRRLVELVVADLFTARPSPSLVAGGSAGPAGIGG